ncbi:DOMON domain-containing protein [Trichostrongylus colubriformis]|uniref:DOMON domain-containing protein n=1 Tax=Trichostrongylus colubriformis TaxID=6319 RepID=A0AAN8F5J2_TRICO
MAAQATSSNGSVSYDRRMDSIGETLCRSKSSLLRPIDDFIVKPVHPLIILKSAVALESVCWCNQSSPSLMLTNALLVAITFSYSLAFSFEGCNVTQSCWFHPPNCNENERGKCISGVRWNTEPDGIKIQLQTHVNDLDPHRPAYAALGFSYNQRMDDDTVVECVQPLQGQPGQVRVSFNDETFNSVLPQASSVLLQGGSVVLQDGVLTCDMKLLLDNVPLVSNKTKFMIHDLEARPYYLLFARGNADPWTLEKDIHSVNDDPQFPWMTQEKVRFS